MGRIGNVLTISFGIILTLKFSTSIRVEESYLWKNVNYDWLDNEIEDEAIKSGNYIPKNNLPIGIAPWKDKIFIAVPRFKTGVPSSLNYITKGDSKSPKLIPYPSWDVNMLPSDNDTEQIFEMKEEGTESSINENYTIASVFRIWIDKCDRLWALDVGEVDLMGSKIEINKPSLLIFDLKTDSLIKRATLKTSCFGKDSFFGHIVVDVNSEHCDKAFAYITDLQRSTLIVYSLYDDNSWNVMHHYFNFDPLAGQYNIGGIKFQWTDGIVGLALSDLLDDGSRRVFFHATSSTKEFEVSNKVLQNETWAKSTNNFHDFKFVGEKGIKSQSTASFFDEESEILLYTQIQLNGVACWNSKKILSPNSTALFVSDSSKLQFPSDIKIYDEVIFVLSNKLQKFIFDSLDAEEVNFRILTIPLNDMISVCM